MPMKKLNRNLIEKEDLVENPLTEIRDVQLAKEKHKRRFLQQKK